jgi:hypothetical protein
MKITRHILFLLIVSGLLGQIEQEKKPKTFLFGLIKIKSNSPYEKGAWIDKWIHAREFALPVYLAPIEIRYGFGFNGKTSGSVALLNKNSATDDPDKMEYEDDVEPLSQSYENIWGSSMEVDVGLINIPYYLVGTSWMNVMTGLTYRSSSIFYGTELPSEAWGEINTNWSDTAYFSPKMSEYLLTTHFQYQPFSDWFINFRYSYGLASTLFYTQDREVWDESLTGSGTSAAGSIGFRYILDPGKENRFTVGLDFRYSYTKIHTINDLADITPISQFDLVNYGLYFTLSAFYGGDNTIGDKAKKHYYRKEYVSARNQFREFLSENPSHANRHRAEYYIKDSEYKIPYAIMDEGIVLDKKSQTQKALDKYMYARSLVKNDTLILNTLNKRINQIALLWMFEAENILNDSRYVEAYSLVKHVAEFSKHGEKEIRRFKSWVVLGEGKRYQSAGFIGKAMGKYAEALGMNPDLIYEVKSLQYRAGIQMAKLAKEADEFEEIQLAIYSLEYARELSGGIGTRNEKLLVDLKNKLKSLSDYKSRIIIEQKMNIARAEQLNARNKKLKIGLTIPQVQDLLGEPHEKILGNRGLNPDEQLWIYFVNQGSLHLSFHQFQLFKIEEL